MASCNVSPSIHGPAVDKGPLHDRDDEPPQRPELGLITRTRRFWSGGHTTRVHPEQCVVDAGPEGAERLRGASFDREAGDLGTGRQVLDLLV